MNAKDKDLCRATAEQAGKVEGDVFVFLQDGDVIREGDEVIDDDCQSWAKIKPLFIGMGYRAKVGKSCRRLAKPTQPAATQQPVAYERESFKACHQHFDLTEDQDAWGRKKFKHSHVDAMFDGWKERAAVSAPVSPSREVEALLQRTVECLRYVYDEKCTAGVLRKDIAEYLRKLAPVQENAP